MKERAKISHPAADAMDWDEAMQTIVSLRDADRLRDAMLIGVGCYLGLRVSDFRLLRWSDLLDERDIVLIEKKTGKKRRLRVNPALRDLAQYCFDEIEPEDRNGYIFNSCQCNGTKPLSRNHIHCLLKKIQKDCGIGSAKVFSAHTLRKTFGRRVWLQECRKGRGDQALELLKEIFGHEHVHVTKRYLGIRQEELLSVYENL